MVISDNIVVILAISSMIISILNVVYMIHTKMVYKDFMKKIGNGHSIDIMLREYLDDVKEIKKDNDEIKRYYTTLNNNIDSCIQKVGLVRYNAFKDVGSDLSFALALLDRNNSGVVLNGLFGSDSSNIFAKPIKNGESKYQLSQEEIEAMEIARQSKEFYTKVKNNKF